jgi:hypothetical protein
MQALLNQDLLTQGENPSQGESHQQLNQDGSVMLMPRTKPSPYSNFMRATTGKKLYFTDNKAGPLPLPKINETTRIRETKQRTLYRTGEGKPLFKSIKHTEFIPVNPGEARKKLI